MHRLTAPKFAALVVAFLPAMADAQFLVQTVDTVPCNQCVVTGGALAKYTATVGCLTSTPEVSYNGGPRKFAWTAGSVLPGFCSSACSDTSLSELGRSIVEGEAITMVIERDGEVIATEPISFDVKSLQGQRLAGVFAALSVVSPDCVACCDANPDDCSDAEPGSECDLCEHTVITTWDFVFASTDCPYEVKCEDKCTQEPIPAADVDVNGVIDVSDLLMVILNWGCNYELCPGNANADDTVGVDDLLAVILNWTV